ncbi:unnamed protein product [Miscanthus lutarioriparius]|uniref:Uncharacterized protein n=1 Tax=Miscanthus lutarioriparius TaxID=422564 RepID=A0A811RG10_9POAL|nr:unnamed protein product [Miscanthus lutarioriparius]
MEPGGISLLQDCLGTRTSAHPGPGGERGAAAAAARRRAHLRDGSADSEVHPRGLAQRGDVGAIARGGSNSDGGGEASLSVGPRLDVMGGGSGTVEGEWEE